MNKKKPNILIFTLSILIGYFIVINFQIEGKPNEKLNVKQYQNAQEEKNEILSEINKLKSDNKKMRSTVYGYENRGNNIKIVGDMRNLLEEYGMITGLNEVSGPGIVIKINDGKPTKYDSDYEKLNKILHDEDVENVLNVLRVAGAEAMSLNEHRITPRTGLRCYWAFIMFEDKNVEYPIFNFYAIGDPDVLEEEVMKDGGYIKRLMFRGLDVSVEKKEEIILKSASIKELKYGKEYIKK